MPWTILGSQRLLRTSLMTFRMRFLRIVLAWIILQPWSTRSRNRWSRHLIGQRIQKSSNKSRWTEPNLRNKLISIPIRSSSNTAPIEFSITKSFSICQWVIIQERMERHCHITVLQHLRCLLRVWSPSIYLRMTSFRRLWEETQSVHFVASLAPDLAIDKDGRRRSRAHVYVTNILKSLRLIQDFPSISCPSVREDTMASETTWNLIKSVFCSRASMNSRFMDTRTARVMWAMSYSINSWAPMKK